MKRFTVLVTLATLVFATTPNARGESSASAAEAKEHAERAFAAFGLRRFEDAAREYEAAFALKPDPALLFDAAQSNRFANKKQRAIELYESYLRLFPKSRIIGDVKAIVDKLKVAVADDERAAAAPPNTLKSTESPESPEPAARPAPTPVAVAPEPASPSASTTLVAAPPERNKPVYKKGWFWGVVAGSVVVAGGAVVLGVLLGGSGSPPTASAGTVRGN